MFVKACGFDDSPLDSAANPIAATHSLPFAMNQIQKLILVVVQVVVTGAP